MFEKQVIGIVLLILILVFLLIAAMSLVAWWFLDQRKRDQLLTIELCQKRREHDCKLSAPCPPSPGTVGQML